MFHSLPSFEPVELIAVAFNISRRFAAWLTRTAGELESVYAEQLGRVKSRWQLQQVQR